DEPSIGWGSDESETEISSVEQGRRGSERLCDELRRLQDAGQNEERATTLAPERPSRRSLIERLVAGGRLGNDFQSPRTCPEGSKEVGSELAVNNRCRGLSETWVDDASIQRGQRGRPR